MEDSPFPFPERGAMEDSDQLESIRFYTLPLAEKLQVLLDQRESLLEQHTRLELQQQQLEASQARQKRQLLALTNQQAALYSQ